ncbi:hypothetical protein RBI22_15245 [Alcaligenaceae bacterium C4P045]|nr:hypothetical protein [Alcaligenaceae bacterium C4P045]
MAIKPRIVLVTGFTWECRCELLARKGNSQKQAYDRWMKAALRRELVHAGFIRPNNKEAAAERRAELAEQPQEVAKRAPAEPYIGTPAAARKPSTPKPLTLPNALRLAGQRAAQHQPPMHSITTTVKRFDGFLGQSGGL